MIGKDEGNWSAGEYSRPKANHYGGLPGDPPCACEECCPVEKQSGKAKREPVDYLYNKLNWNFIKLMAQIAHYGESKYGCAENYTKSELEGDKSPMNHMADHMKRYLGAEEYERFDGKTYWHLAAIAYNAMMEFYYHCQRGDAKVLYGRRKEDKK